jgi:subtilisin family serine protease
MTVYIIRPKTTTVARSLKLASRKFTPESRSSQVAEVVNFWQEDSGYQEITNYLEDSNTITQYPTYSNITGAKVVDIPDEEVEQIRQDLPNALILRDFPIELIQPVRNLTGTRDTIDQNDIWHLEAISLNLARQRGFTGTGKGITVAVLDSGIEANHSEIEGKVIASYRLNPRTREIQPVPFEDTDGHGTHVTGLICGNQVGVAPEAKIINCIMFPNGRISNFSDWIFWFDWLAKQLEINIVNISAGQHSLTPQQFKAISDSIDELTAIGILPVCAVGNEGWNNSRTPGNCKNSLSVGAIKKQDQIYQVAAFSGNNTIIENQYLSYNVPHVVAPGEGVYSSVKGGGYEAWNGTSMATPIVSGVAALILERDPTMTYLDLFDAVRSNCQDLGLDSERQGQGLVQIPTTLY